GVGAGIPRPPTPRPRRSRAGVPGSSPPPRSTHRAPLDRPSSSRRAAPARRAHGRRAARPGRARIDRDPGSNSYQAPPIAEVRRALDEPGLVAVARDQLVAAWSNQTAPTQTRLVEHLKAPLPTSGPPPGSVS